MEPNHIQAWSDRDDKKTFIYRPLVCDWGMYNLFMHTGFNDSESLGSLHVWMVNLYFWWLRCVMLVVPLISDSLMLRSLGSSQNNLRHSDGHWDRFCVGYPIDQWFLPSSIGGCERLTWQHHYSVNWHTRPEGKACQGHTAKPFWNSFWVPPGLKTRARLCL